MLEDSGKYFHLRIVWDRDFLANNLSYWFSNVKLLNYLPLFVIWECWKVRNFVLFEDGSCCPSVVVARIVGDNLAWKPVQEGKVHAIK